MHFNELTQGSEEWKAARLGKVTASRMADLTAKTRSGWGASRANYMAELLVERLTELSTDSYTNGPMQWGKDHEAEARMEYQLKTGFDVEQVGFVPHPTIAMAGCSPDGLVSPDGAVEIKCPNSANHIETLLGWPPRVPDKYLKQIQFQLACTGRLWCDFVSYDPRLPERYRLFVRRVERDQPLIEDLEKCAKAFLKELDQKLDDLEQLDTDHF